MGEEKRVMETIAARRCEGWSYEDAVESTGRAGEIVARHI